MSENDSFSLTRSVPCTPYQTFPIESGFRSARFDGNRDIGTVLCTFPNNWIMSDGICKSVISTHDEDFWVDLFHPVDMQRKIWIENRIYIRCRTYEAMYCKSKTGRKPVVCKTWPWASHFIPSSPQNKPENEENHFADAKTTHEHPTDIVRSQTPKTTTLPSTPQIEILLTFNKEILSTRSDQASKNLNLSFQFRYSDLQAIFLGLAFFESGLQPGHLIDSFLAVTTSS